MIGSVQAGLTDAVRLGLHTCSNEPVQGLGRESLRDERMKQTEFSTQAGLTITRSRKQAR